MACLTPIRMFLKDSKGFEHVFYSVGCGCYNCQNQARGEWVYRVTCEVELRLPFFITLTYDNEHLPVDVASLPPEYHGSRTRYIGDIMAGHKLKRKWDYCYVRKDHYRQFWYDLQEEFKRRFFDVMFEKYEYTAPNGRKWIRDRPKKGFEEFHLIRKYATAEYGTFSHRAHYHALLFVPIKVHRADVVDIVRKCWHYGNADVAKDCRDAAVNYVAKHQVKSDHGSTFQRRCHPIFKMVSVYKGGIGYNAANKESNYTKYCHTDEDGDFDQRWFQVIDRKGKTYTIPFPRFLSRRFRKRYAKEHDITENLTDAELHTLSLKSVKKFTDEFINFISCEPKAKAMTYDEQRAEFYRFGKQESYNQRHSYEVKRYAAKKQKLLQKYGYTLNVSEENEPF